MSVIRASVALAMAVFLVNAVGLSGRAWSDDIEGLSSDARAAIQDLADSLRQELVAAMAQGGPIEAISACNLSAPAIAESQSQQHGLEITRTALRLRNPANAPDAFELAVLERFLAEAATGKPVASLEHAELVEANGKRVFRFMKAIPMAEKPCLACHGADIAPPVAARITELYPNDEATGFSVGDLRGAFTVTKALD